MADDFAKDKSSSLNSVGSIDVKTKAADKPNRQLLNPNKKRNMFALAQELEAKTRAPMDSCKRNEDSDRSSETSTSTVADQLESEAAEMSDSSIGSDGSDAFHVTVEPEKWWTTTEDVEL